MVQKAKGSTSLRRQLPDRVCNQFLDMCIPAVVTKRCTASIQHGQPSASHHIYTSVPALQHIFLMHSPDVQAKPNLLQLPLDVVDPIMSYQVHDWEYIALIEGPLATIDTDVRNVWKRSPSAVDSICTEALLYTSTDNLQTFKQRMQVGLNGSLEFAGMYAGIAAKYAYFCSLGKREIVLHHLSTRSPEVTLKPLLAEQLVSAEATDQESMSEGLDYAKKSWAIMQELPKTLTYGTSG